MLSLIVFESNFIRHVNFRCKGTEPKKQPGFKCNQCNVVFPQQEKLQKHPCTRMAGQPDDTYVTYTLKPIDCPLVVMIKESKDLNLKQRVCYTERIAIEGIYPWVDIPFGGLRKHQANYPWKNISCVNGGIDQCIATLNEKVICGRDNFIDLHKRIRVVDSKGNEIARLTEELLNLKSKYLTVVDCGNYFRVSLVTLPKPEFFMRPQPLDNEKDLTVYQTYRKGYTFPPHRYPPYMIKNENLWLEPWKFDERSLKVITGTRLEAKS